MLWYQEGLCKHKHALSSSQHKQGQGALGSDGVSRASHSCPVLNNQDQLKIPGWRSVINPGFRKELGELILPLTILCSDIKLERICHCKEFALLFDLCCLSSATPLVSNCLNKNCEFSGWYKTLQ